MEMSEVSKKTALATRWSSLTEIIAKLVTPISSMVLARLLVPEVFGMIATINMVISFADMFTDAGFQKFLIQHEFKDEKDLDDSTTVAFWTNLSVSLLIWFFICVFSGEIAKLVGNPGLGNAIAVAAISLPLTSFSSIQMARYKRKFDFKTLFYVRIVCVCVPLFVTVPLAFITRSFWALIIGTIAGNLANAIILTARSEWKPNLFFSMEKLKEMFSFSWWILLESISIWLTSYIGTFIVGTNLSDYYLGIYKTSMTTTNQVIGLITSATSAPLFTALSKLQNDDKDFSNVFFQYIQAISIFVIPLGVGMYLFRDLTTAILLGNQWGEAADFIGLWALTSSFCLVLGTYISGLYNAKGKPVLSFVVQMLHLVVLIPVLIIGSQISFKTLYISRSLVRFEFVAVQMIFMKIYLKMSPLHLVKTIVPSLICTIIMSSAALVLGKVTNTMIWQMVSVVICIIVYFISMRILYKETFKKALNILGLSTRIRFW